MKITVIVFDYVSGTVWHRLVTPHVAMARLYQEIKIDFVSGIENIPDDKLKETDILVTNFTYWTSGQYKRVREMGIKVVIDFDDYWYLEKTHLQYERFVKYKMWELVEFCAQYGDMITVTTPILANRVKRFGITTVIFPNAIDPNDKSWNGSPPKTWEGFRFGYTGASEHKADLKQILGCENTFDIYLFRFYRQFFGNRKFNYYNEANKQEYPLLYNNWDAVIAPLVKNEFNIHKSELKMVEAGWKRKPIIVSGIPPYTLLAKNNKNCLVVNTNKSFDWVKAMNRIKQNPSLREDLVSGLRDDVEKKYNLEKQAVERYQIYSSLID